MWEGGRMDDSEKWLILVEGWKEGSCLKRRIDKKYANDWISKEKAF